MTCMAGWSSRVVCQSVTAGPGFCPRPQPSIWPGGVGRGLAGDPPPPAACAQVLGADKHPSAPPTPGGQLAGLIYLLQNPDMLQVRLHKPPTPPPPPPPPPPPGPLPQTTPSHPLIRLGHTQVEGLEIKDINVLTQLQLQCFASTRLVLPHWTKIIPPPRWWPWGRLPFTILLGLVVT